MIYKSVQMIFTVLLSSFQLQRITTASEHFTLKYFNANAL